LSLTSLGQTKTLQMCGSKTSLGLGTEYYY
jgi:hypothetical protein